MTPTLVRNRNVKRLHERKATVQNVLRDALTMNQFTKVIVIGMDKEGYLYCSHSQMTRIERIGLAEFAKAKAVKALMDSPT